MLRSHFSFAQDSALAPEFFWSLLEESVSSFSPADTFSSLDVPRSPRHLRSPPNPRCMSAPPTPLCPKEDTHARGEGGTARLEFFSGPESSWKHPDHHPKRTVPPYPRPVQTTSCTPVPIWALLLRAALPRGAGAGSWRRRSAPHRACWTRIPQDLSGGRADHLLTRVD